SPASSCLSSTIGASNRWTPVPVVTFTRSSRNAMGAVRPFSPVRSPSTNGTPLSATPHTPTLSSTVSFTTPIASISPARASDADAQDRSQGIDHQPTTLPKIYCQQGARQPGDIISYRRATSSRNQRATSSESAARGGIQALLTAGPIYLARTLLLFERSKNRSS